MWEILPKTGNNNAPGNNHNILIMTKQGSLLAATAYSSGKATENIEN
jgi:hypothetical protein